MKKTLLSLVAFVATLSASAQWTSSFEFVNDAEKLQGTHTTIAADGSVYVSSTYNQDFTFAEKVTENPDEWTSASIVKYNAKGEELWAVTMEGAAIVYALDTDADGTLYAAGNFLSGVTYTGTDGVSNKITSEDVYSAFIAKISADGVFEAVNVITPESNQEIALSEFPFYLALDPIKVAPSKIQVEGDKVYVLAEYTGDVASLGWKGSYVLVDFMMYLDNGSTGIFSLNKADLTDAKSVANVQMTGVIAETASNTDAMSFVAENGIVYAGFIGFGNLTLTTANGTEDFAFTASEEGTEHSFVLATIGETTTTKTFTAKHNKMYVPYNLFMEADGDNLIIGGTYHGELPFDNEITTELASTPFMASVKKTDASVNWAYTGEEETTATCMTINGNALIASADANITSIDLTTGEAQTTTNAYTYCCADKNVAVATEETKVHIFVSEPVATGLEEVIAPERQEDIRYNLVGQMVDKNYKGLVIANGKKLFVK